MAMKSLKKIKAKLQFLYRQNEFLNLKLPRLLCNCLFQPHFDYAYISCCSLASKKIRKKIHVTQSKCTSFGLKLNLRHHKLATIKRKSRTARCHKPFLNIGRGLHHSM